MATNPSAGDTVNPTKTSITIDINNETKSGQGFRPRKIESFLVRAESTPAARKRPLIQDLSSPKAEVVPTKSPRRGGQANLQEDEPEDIADKKHEVIAESRINLVNKTSQSSTTICESRPDVLRDKPKTRSEIMKKCQATNSRNVEKRISACSSSRRTLKRSSEDVSDGFKSSRLKNRDQKDETDPEIAREISQDNSEQISARTQKPQTIHQQFSKRDEAVKLRKTIQWLEEGARRMREDLAATRAELHEERRAARLAKRELESAVKDAKVGEAARHLQIISELKSRLAQSPTRPSADPMSTASSKAEFLKGENHRRELSALRKRLAEAEANVQKLKANACSPHGSGKRRKVESPDGRRLEVEVQALRTANKKLEERLQVVTEAERKRGAELRIQHENHEAQLATLQRTLRSDTIKMMDEIRSKNREIEKLEKIVMENCQIKRKLQTKEDDLMRKLRETERSHQIRLVPRIEEKLTSSTDHVENSCNGDCDAAAEVERLRELSVEQQEVIEVLRQAVKEKERKLDQISNKKRKEEFYKQWLELEPVVEVEDEDEHEHEEGDSALSSAPSSLSPQPGVCGQWQHAGVTREAYETVLLEVEELQTRLVEEQRELAHAKSQVRDLEKALLQETRGSQNSRRALSDKLREIEDREATLVAEISELREQNELLEFRVLELEESPCLRDTPDPADSGIVSPEPIHLYKDQLMKHRDRAVATVIPYNTYNSPVSPIPQKPPLSLQESGIFDEEDEAEVELASCGTQTETPAGDLLQEVQRLHELRARIQERAVKVPVPDSTEITTEVSSQANFYQERIRELEQRLEAHEEAENKRIQDKILSKQREEDLLDENYRLTEKIYWFENVLRNSKNSSDDCKLEQETSERENFSEIEEDHEESNSTTIEQEESDDNLSSESTVRKDDGGKIDESSRRDSGTGRCNECGKIGKQNNERLEELVEVEVSTKRRIADLEHRENTYIKTLQKADETWVQKEIFYSTQIEELRDKLKSEATTNEKLNRQVEELEDKIKFLKRCSVCEDDLVLNHQYHCPRGFDEVDPCLAKRNIEPRKCEISKKRRISTAMDVDEDSDVVDGSSGISKKGNREDQKNVQKRNQQSNVSNDDRNSVTSAVSVVNLNSQLQDTKTRTPKSVSKVLVPEIVAELAIEAKEEEEEEEVLFLRNDIDSVKKCDSKILEINGNTEEKERRLPVSKKDQEERDEEEEEEEEEGLEVIVEAEEAKAETAEAEVTINETEPEKKVRQKRNGNKERERQREREWERARAREGEGWVMKAWNKNRIGKIEKNFPGHRIYRLVLYQELCV